MWACLTIQQVSGAQVDVDAGMEARDEAVESSFLHTLTWNGRTDRGTAVRRLRSYSRDVCIPSSQLWKILAVREPSRSSKSENQQQTGASQQEEATVPSFPEPPCNTLGRRGRLTVSGLRDKHTHSNSYRTQTYDYRHFWCVGCYFFTYGTVNYLQSHHINETKRRNALMLRSSSMGSIIRKKLSCCT